MVTGINKTGQILSDSDEKVTSSAFLEFFKYVLEHLKEVSKRI